MGLNYYIFSFLVLSIQSYDCKSFNFSSENVTVTIDQGTLQGKIAVDYFGEPYYSFEGIPYAKPPVGVLRFKAPKPPKPWSGVLNATYSGPICMQASTYAEVSVEQSEDCLKLNVYTKMEKSKKPVMVWIHGGEFIAVLSQTTRPDILMIEDVVIVSVQYRLNIFGFLSFEDTSLNIPGNAGLKDQVMALRWVQKNIEYFGGDPNQVTIFGQSAGGASVHLLYLSPLAKGLFHRAIAQSGAASNPWVTGLNVNYELVEILKCHSGNDVAVLNCFNQKISTELVSALNEIQTEKDMKTGEFVVYNSVVVEKGDEETSFLSESPESIILQGKFSKVPFMTGFCSHEGAALFNYTSVSPDFTFNEKLVPKDMNISNSEDAEKIGYIIKEFYYGSSTPSWNLTLQFTNYLTDVMFLEKMFRHVKQQSQVAPEVPVFFYNFNYHTVLNIHDVELNIPNQVAHGDDLGYLFYIPGFTPSDLDPKENAYIGMHRMIKFFTKFAKTGNPNNDDPLSIINWEPVRADEFNYLEISPNMTLKINPVEDRMNFWENLYASL